MSNLKNKRIPENILTKVAKALSYFPSLEDIPITFKFKKDIKKSTMQAQPQFLNVLFGKKPRHYVIFISEKFKISGTDLKTRDIPHDVFIGWIGHELGHIMDYEEMSNSQLICFGFKYIFLEKHIINAERKADHFAIQQGMEDYIMKTKNFILNNADITQAYKNRIKRYYLSPEEIIQLVNNRNNVTSKP
ncbi:hypothetical protein [Tenacibaculum aestuariivivum]|uniref:hypothetical protein n=1 Tax=Tenacibaculum aestuariivivum TaxID=2006131 RepID=UPI003AB413AB